VFDVSLPSGTCHPVCFGAGPASRMKPHFMKGMIQEIHVS
jgi:hypothetical protein